jgi:hypothetical protein
MKDVTMSSLLADENLLTAEDKTEIESTIQMMKDIKQIQQEVLDCGKGQDPTPLGTFMDVAVSNTDLICNLAIAFLALSRKVERMEKQLTILNSGPWLK